jgi:amino acid adenylation domain-containing protein
MKGPSKRLEELSRNKRILFELLLEERKREAIPQINVAPGRPQADTFPMSFAQERLWFLNRLDPHSHLYNVPFSMRLTGKLNIFALEQSIKEIIRRHEILRTTFTSLNDRPVQIIHRYSDESTDEAIGPLSILDLRQLRPAESRSLTARLIAQEGQAPFDLSKGPLLRTTMLWIGESEYVLLLTMHHIVTDGWSIGVFMRELAELYTSFSRGIGSPLSELPIQYADFAVWQEQWLQGGVLEAQLGYWKKQLGGQLSSLEVMGDRPRPSVRAFHGSSEPIVLSRTSSLAIKALGRKQNATVYMTLLAAFKTLLYRYTGQTDILVGSPLANRNQAATGDLIGFFVNTLVLRTDLSGNPSFKKLIERVRDVTLEAYSHQDLPFERLVEELKPERDLSRTPIFQVMFVLQNAPLPPLQLSGVRFSYVEFDHEASRFDLSLSMMEGDEGLEGSLEYNTGLFDGSTIKRMAEHFKVLLHGMIAHPEREVSGLPLLTGAEERQLLIEWNQTRNEYRLERCLHQEFEAQAESTPDVIAANFEDASLTYRELNKRANQLAHYLGELGAGPERFVAIYLEHSLEMLIGLLGILKSGAAYIPLDLQAPQERLDYVLKDIKATVLLTRLGRIDLLPSCDSPIVCLDSDWAEISRRDASNPTSGVTVRNLMYAIYTSGSTGQPKGIMIEHKSAVNYLRWINEMLARVGVECVPALTQLTFDASLRQVFAPLLRGDDVWLLRSGIVTEPNSLVEALCQRRNIAISCVPSLWRAILDSIHSEQASALGECVRAVFLGGERLSDQLFEATSRALPKSVVWNAYGPTETTVNACGSKVERDKSITIGRPISNTVVYLLDNHLQPVPIGVPGELCIGGIGLSRGYLNRSDQTAENFICNPFAREPGERLYRSGDLVRYLADGRIEFLGRIDHQVKIRGFRIELQEIASTLCRHPIVREAVVTSREDSRGRKWLVAYIVADTYSGIVDDLRRFVTEKLPNYMVPSTFVILDELPLTSSGKTDYRSLPQSQEPDADSQKEYQPPQTPVEEKVAAIWADVLGVERVGIYDNFFELGGHSLLAISLFSRLHEAFTVELLMRDLFESPTVASLAEAIERARKVKDESTEPMLIPLPREAYRAK